jgi:hypothetical protein
MEERKRNSGNSRRSDFLEILLRVNNLSEEEKVSFVLDSLLGGYETTSLLMAMVVHFLALSPPAFEQLKVTFPICHVHIYIPSVIYGYFLLITSIVLLNI